jgi:sodium-dependent dicarboxylate transporter 2/3/5
MGFYWMTEVLPLAVTAFIPLIFYPAFGILKAADVSAVYLAVKCG